MSTEYDVIIVDFDSFCGQICVVSSKPTGVRAAVFDWRVIR